MPVQYGVSVPNFGDYGDARRLAELAREAENAGWDGFFIWDHIAFQAGMAEPFAEPWVALTAIAMHTARIRLGPLVTPVARRRPWVLARETVTLDHLSGGRLILGVGLGFPPDAEFMRFGEEGDDRVRAAKLDEGLAILAGLWSGEPFSFAGEHFRIEETTFLPRPVQSPRIPIWVAGYWPNRRPFRRAARWDGMFPESLSVGWERSMPVDEVYEVLDYVHQNRALDTPFDVVIGGETSGSDRARDSGLITPYIEAGMTWWIENLHGYRAPFEEMQARLRLGPPA